MKNVFPVLLIFVLLLLVGCSEKNKTYSSCYTPNVGDPRSGYQSYSTYKYDWKLGNSIRIQSDGRRVNSNVRIGSYEMNTTRPAPRYRK